MTELQEGWTYKQLGGRDGITKVVNGSTPSTDEPLYWDGDILWATPTDIGKLNGVYLTDTERKITEVWFKQLFNDDCSQRHDFNDKPGPSWKSGNC